MDEQKFTGEPLNLSFPAVQNQQKTDKRGERVESPVVSGDIVDSSWDFEPLTFPDFAAEAEKGPRHAAPKRNILSALGADTTGASDANEPESCDTDEDPDSQGNATVFLPETASSEGTHPLDHMPATPVTVEQQPDQAQVFGGEQTVTLSPVVGGAEELDNVSESEDSGSGSRRSASGKRAGTRRRNTIITIVVLAIVLVAGIGGFVLWKGGQSGKHDDAVAACSEASEQYGKAKKALNAALKSAESAQSITASQVTDATTIEQLKQQVNNAGHYGEAQSCAASRSLAELKNGTETMETQTTDMNRSAEAIRKAVSAVNISKTAMGFNSLKDAVATAQDLLNSSNGNVSDESTRSALQEAIDAANALISKNSTDDAAITSALSALRSASDKVENSMSAATSQSASGNDGTYGYTAYGYNTNGYNGYGNGTYNDGQNQNNTNTGGQQNTGGNDSDSGSNSGNAGGEASGSGGTGNTGGNSQNGAGTGAGNTQSSGQGSGNNQ
ncbi:FIVAR domain-containing protein [Bifidobacterium angulatum]|uniref:FIVAR domain-containing protein n=1 Tax=Bifidobacterium angulatum TaxID=1683 RepID=UPI0005F8EEF9|nr:FIVAR domain-containing protein [Bifidobacterium angulatum]AMK57572.1 hypothetical protein Bang102_003225 [Bifidobacterium angulatum]